MSEFKFFVKTLQGSIETFGEKDNLHASSKMKEMFEVVSKKLGLESTALRLIFQDKEVRNIPKLTLSDYKIKSNSVLIEAHNYEFFVKTFQDGKTLLFGQQNNLYPESKVSELFAVLSQRVKIPEEEIRLVYSGKELDIKNTLKDYKIIKNSTIILVLRLRGGKLQFCQ